MHTASQQKARPSDRGFVQSKQHLLLWALLLLALGLRLTRILSQPLWWDEGWSLYFAGSDPGAILRLTAVDIHPPLYYLLLHAWIRPLSSSVLSVRLLSVLIGTATVPLLYVTASRLLDRRAALLAASLLAISPFHIYYSQEVRMYGLVTFVGLLAWYCALRWEAQGSRWALGYALSMAAALYSDYYAVFLFLGLNTVVLVHHFRARRPARHLWSWLAAQAVVLALYAPWLWYAAGRLLTYVRFKVGIEGYVSQGLVTYLARHLAAFDWGHAEGALAAWWWLGLLPLALLVLGLAVVSRSPQRHGVRWREGSLWWPWAIVLVSLVGGFALNLVFPFNPPRGERLLLLALPAYLLLFAAGLLTLWRRRPAFAALPAVSLVLLAALSLAFFYTVPRYPDDDYRPLAARIGALGLPGDAILSVHPWQEGYFLAYLPDGETRPALVLTPRQVLPHEQQLWDADPVRLAADLDALLAEHGRLWFADHQAMGRVLEARIEAHLLEGAYPVLREWYGPNTVLSLFSAGEPSASGVSARFGDWLNLDEAAFDPGPLESAWGVVPVDLTWRLSERPAETYHIGLRLTDDAGRVWAQRDSPPGGGLARFQDWRLDEPYLDRHGLLVPAGTPPGEYNLTLRVYRSEDVSVLPVTFEGGSGGEVTLGRVRVTRPDLPPPVAALEMEQPLQVDWDRLRLLGYNPDSRPTLRPGEVVAVDLFWQALTEPGEDLLPRLQLLDAAGQSLVEATAKPVAGTYPTAWWQAGELVRDPQSLPLPAALPPGRYRLVLSLIRAADGAAVEPGSGQTLVDLGEVQVEGREHRYEATQPTYRQEIEFGQTVELIGYDVGDAPQAPGSSLEVTLHWQALQTPDRNYYTFVHLLDREGQIVAQHDGVPGNGELPTLGWLPGEYLTDSHRLHLPVDLPAGEYRLGVGLYDPLTGQRLGERVLLETPVRVDAN